MVPLEFDVLCVCVFACAGVRVCVFGCMCVHVCVYVRVLCVCVCLSLCVCVCVHACVYVHVCACVFIWLDNFLDTAILVMV